jgi:hypothetical protein
MEKLIKRMEHAVGGRQRESHSGEAKRRHGEAAAEQLLEAGLAALGLTSADLAGLPKGAAEKVALADWLRERTTVSLRWAAERLAMGHYTNVSHGVNKLPARQARKVQPLRATLGQL